MTSEAQVGRPLLQCELPDGQVLSAENRAVGCAELATANVMCSSVFSFYPCNFVQKC